ncbi:MAG: tRNA (guanosine(46)-N7)-methyltransferase TrmB [Geminicoccaceae bacterium]|nr:MAG: tRNA (guanosine(46)-N7)-methyltransferase TrmB [Geminicoccaceae bacterium]
MTLTDACEGRPRRVLYGRRLGPRLKPNRRRLLEESLPEVRLTLPARGERLEVASLLRPGTDRLWLEIGFGGGEHLAFQAAAHPGVTHVGVEPYLNGVASLLGEIEARHLTNVRVLVDDARLLLEALPDGALERIAVLFPDPWPKLRHRKRRIVNRATVAAFTRLLVPGGELRLASDDPGYLAWMLDATLAEPRLVWLAERARDWRQRADDWPETRYEAKAKAAGRQPAFLRFRRV